MIIPKIDALQRVSRPGSSPGDCVDWRASGRITREEIAFTTPRRVQSSHYFAYFEVLTAGECQSRLSRVSSRRLIGKGRSPSATSSVAGDHAELILGC